MKYRDLLEDVRPLVPVKHYAVDARVNGNVPLWASDRLPLFGDPEGSEQYLSSGGRSIILEGDGVYRIKGVDPFGYITQAVAGSGKCLINDVAESVDQVPPEGVQDSMREAMGKGGSSIDIPPYKEGKPFSFLTFQNAANAERAFNALGEAYDERGFSLPCRFTGRVVYPDVKLNGSMVYSLVFQLPDAESDLRMTEFRRLMYNHLQHASPEQLRELEESLTEVFLGLVKWHAFDCRVLTDNYLAPAPNSFLGQNHVIGRVGGGLGLTRVDHTSTEHRPDVVREELRDYVSHFRGTLSYSPFALTQALEMSESGAELNRERFAGWFDAAYKYREAISPDDFPRTCDVSVRLREEFDSAFEAADPEPVSEEQLVSLVERVREIEIDEEFEVRREESSAKALAELVAKGLTLGDVIGKKITNWPRLE